MFVEGVQSRVCLCVCVWVPGEMLSGSHKASSWLIGAAEYQLKPPDQAGMCSVFVPCLLEGHTSLFPLVPWVLFRRHKKSICLLRWVWSTTEPLLFSCLSLSRWAYLRCLQSRSPLSGIVVVLSGLGFQPQVRRSRRGWEPPSVVWPLTRPFAFLLLKSYKPGLFTVALFVFLTINFLCQWVTLVERVWLWICT